MLYDKTCLTYWFPKIKEAGLPVPKTVILMLSEEEKHDAYSLLDGETPQILLDFIYRIKEAISLVGGLPCFLRTGQTSAKHSWDGTCYVEYDDADYLLSHIGQLIEFSCIADIRGLDFTIWAVREFLPIMPIGYCPKYKMMPVNREFRFFVEDEKIICRHPYWPRGAIEQGGLVLDNDQYARLTSMSEGEKIKLDKIVSLAGKTVGGAWSVDLLETERGWYLTDMAEAHKSWHWEDCPNNKEKTMTKLNEKIKGKCKSCKKFFEELDEQGCCKASYCQAESLRLRAIKQMTEDDGQPK